MHAAKTKRRESSTSAAGQKEHHQLWGVQQPVIVHSADVIVRWDSDEKGADDLRGFRHVQLIDTCTQRCYRLNRQPARFNTLTDTHESTWNGHARGRNLCSLIPMQMFCLVQVTVGSGCINVLFYKTSLAVSLPLNIIFLHPRETLYHSCAVWDWLSIQ